MSNDANWPTAPVDDARHYDRKRGVAAIGNAKLNGRRDGLTIISRPHQPLVSGELK
jgi:hypothetical protein